MLMEDSQLMILRAQDHCGHFGFLQMKAYPILLWPKVNILISCPQNPLHFGALLYNYVWDTVPLL